MDPRENPGIQHCRLNGLELFVVRIPLAQCLGFYQNNKSGLCFFVASNACSARHFSIAP